VSEREFKLLQMLTHGLTSAEMGSRINRSVKGVDAGRAWLSTRLDAHSAADLTRLAVEFFKTRNPHTASVQALATLRPRSPVCVLRSPLSALRSP